MAEYPTNLDPRQLEPHFSRHMMTMTAEGLHHKGDIAMQLAWRDQQIETLTSEIARIHAAIGGRAPHDTPKATADCIIEWISDSKNPVDPLL